MLWPLWKLYHNWIASRKIRMRWFLKEANSPGETCGTKSWDQFKEYDSLCLRYVKRVSRERNDHRLEKIHVKHPHQRSTYAMKFEDPSHEETERQQRCARSKAWNLAKNRYKLKEKDKAAFYFPAEEWVLPAASTKEPEEREFVVDSGASMHMVSKKDLNSAELGTMRRSEESDDGDDGQRRGANKRRSDRICQTIWTYLSKWCFLKKPIQFFLSGSFARITGILTLLAEDALTQSCPQRKISAIWLLQITKILSEESESRNNHRHALREQEVHRGELDGLSSPTPHQYDSTRDEAEAKNYL